MTEMRSGLPIVSFSNQREFDQWLAKQPRETKGAWIKFAKKNSSIGGITKSEAIDSALCHGWIDGQIGAYDDESWLIRFTPRKPASKWSENNRTRALELTSADRMRAAGQAEIDKAKADGRWQVAYASASKAEIPSDLQIALDANPKAAAFFATLTGANRYSVLYRIGAVKKPETRARKIEQFVAMLERGETLH